MQRRLVVIHAQYSSNVYCTAHVCARDPDKNAVACAHAQMLGEVSKKIGCFVIILVLGHCFSG